MESEVKVRKRLPYGMIKEIAIIAGVSVVVVSHVLNGTIMIVRKNKRVVRICGLKVEEKVKRIAAERIKEHNSKILKDAIDQVQNLTASLS